MTTTIPFSASCPECGFTSRDVGLLNNHSCAVQEQGGRCEDFPCCGHELGDCNGQKYGSDEYIKEQVMRSMTDDRFAESYDRQVEYDDYWSNY